MDNFYAYFGAPREVAHKIGKYTRVLDIFG
jgi:hypothetical protein